MLPETDGGAELQHLLPDVLDIVIDPSRPLTNYKLLDDIALELAGKLKIQEVQNVLAEMWLFGVDVKMIGGGASYAGNANRELCTSNGIHTSFVQKGKRAKGEREKSFARENLARVRATTMEESFGIYTANAIALSGRIAKLQPAAG